MTITFWMAQAPQERVQPYPEEPDYWERRPMAPFMEINMTAGNANAILALIAPDFVDYDEDPHGVWDMDTLARVRVAAMRAMNTRIKERALSDGFVHARWVSFGRDSQYVDDRLEKFLALTKVAMEYGFPVSFG